MGRRILLWLALTASAAAQYVPMQADYPPVTDSLALWFDLSQPSNMVLDASNYASTIYDRSPRMRHAAQPNASNQARWYPDSCGRGGLRFVRTRPDYYTFRNSPQSSALTVYAVMSRGTPSASFEYWLAGFRDSATTTLNYIALGSNLIGNSWGYGWINNNAAWRFATSTYALPFTLPTVITYATTLLSSNGTEAGAYDIQGSYAGGGFHTIGLRGYNNNVNDNPYSGVIHEVLVYHQNHTLTQQRAMQAWLAQKWGIRLTAQ